MNPGTGTLTEERVNLLLEIEKSFKERLGMRKSSGKLDIFDINVGVDKDDGGPLLVFETVRGRAFFEIEINGSEIVLRTPRCAFSLSLNEVLQQLS